ncbi:putative transposase [Klebsiella pneumoniae]|uniref:Putative transposase n=1 Tax=Klebsiella pneumoniae TaxID=573 RepID=A0A377YQN1_KLEPN|nr:putative transposase [Klebsiella pneumoniae]
MARSAKPRKRIPAPQRSKYPRYVVKLHEDDFFDEEISSGGITLHLHGKRKTVQCPECFKRSDSVHSCRRRRIQHLPCSGQTLWLVFSVRHWYCRNPACSRKIFAGSLVPFASSHQQSSQALQNLQRQLGLIAGGEAGKRAATAVGLRCSADTLLRRVIQPVYGLFPGALIS